MPSLSDTLLSFRALLLLCVWCRKGKGGGHLIRGWFVLGDDPLNDVRDHDVDDLAGVPRSSSHPGGLRKANPDLGALLDPNQAGGDPDLPRLAGRRRGLAGEPAPLKGAAASAGAAELEGFRDAVVDHAITAEGGRSGPVEPHPRARRRAYLAAKDGARGPTGSAPGLHWLTSGG
jgi:hypothetical protein